MFAVGFLHPQLLWALPLVAIPILIHLLNRRRYRTVRWAAQTFLLAAMRRNRRRLRMEQWLVLLLRAAAVLLLVLLVARPQTSGSLLGADRTHHVVCLDDSASMAQRDATSDAYSAALRRAQALAEHLAQSRSGDLLTILRASQPERPDLLEARVGPAVPGRVREVLAGLRLGDSSAQLARLLEEAVRRATQAAEAARAEIYLITDMRRIDWLDEGDKPKPELVAALGALIPDRHRLTLAVVGSANPENVAVVAVRRAGRVAVAGVPVDLTVEVANRGLEAAAATELALAVDDQSRVVVPIEPLDPGEHRQVTFAHTFRSAGFHGVVASLPADAFPVDDSRSLAVEALESSQVLIVDGEAGERPEDAESFYLQAALQHRESGIAVRVIPDHVLADTDLERVAMVFLCNVPAPSPAVVGRLEEFVRRGGGLVVFAGNQVDPELYNERLYKDGAGLLPAQMERLSGDMDRPQSIFVADASHGTMALATEVLERILALAGVGRYMALSKAEGARVVLRLGGSSGPPLLLSRHFGDGGEVMLFTSTADAQWNSLPRLPAYLILTQQMHQTAARVHDETSYNQGPRGTLHLSLDPAIYGPDVVVTARRPDAAPQTHSTRPHLGDAQGDPRAELELPMSELVGTGLFELRLTPHAGPIETRLLARNPEASEGILHRLTPAAWRRAYPESLHERVVLTDAEDAERAPRDAGHGDSWRLLAAGMLGALLLESLLAWRFGRRS